MMLLQKAFTGAGSQGACAGLGMIAATGRAAKLTGSTLELHQPYSGVPARDQPSRRRAQATSARALDRQAVACACSPRKRSVEHLRELDMTATADLGLLQGTLDVLVLKTLSWGARHGYAVARWIKETSDATIQVEDRALYIALHRLEERGLIESEWGLSENNRKAKYYQLTPAGRRELRARTANWTAYANAVFKILRAAA
jgi:PadR family transcriptional regulator, regulatory protein PadR